MKKAPPVPLAAAPEVETQMRVAESGMLATAMLDTFIALLQQREVHFCDFEYYSHGTKETSVLRIELLAGKPRRLH